MKDLHIHAAGIDGSAKSGHEIALRAGFSRRQLAQMIELLTERGDEIERVWNEHFNQCDGRSIETGQALSAAWAAFAPSSAEKVHSSGEQLSYWLGAAADQV